MPVAAVTGAAQGIGRCTAEALARAGYSVALNDLRPPADTLAAARSCGVDVLEFIGNIAEEDVVSRFTKEVKARWNRIDVLVNNAGISFISPAENTGAADFRRVLEVNLLAPFLLCKAFGTMMLQAGSGSIINVASIAGLAGVSDRAAYNASKHGLIGLTRTLAAEWGGRGVRCNAVCPGWVKTAMDSADQARGTYTDADITGRNPMAALRCPKILRRPSCSWLIRHRAVSSTATLLWSTAAGR